MQNTKWIKILVAVLFLGGVTGGITTYYMSQNNKELQTNEQEPDKNDDKKKDQQEDLEIEDEKDKEEDASKIDEDTDESQEVSVDIEKPSHTNSSLNKKPASSTSGNKKPHVPEQSENPEEPTIPEKPEHPESPEEPSIPEVPDEEAVTDLLITNSMLNNGVYKVENKLYNTITISGIEENAKIALDHVTIKENLILVQPERYQLDIVNSNISNMLVTDGIQTFSSKGRTIQNRNKVLQGATINFEESSVNHISISSNVEINGNATVSNITVNNTEEVVLNIPSEKLELNTRGVVVINKNVATVQNLGNGTEININASVTNLVNTKSSTIRISGGNTITHFDNQGENTVVSGNGNITNTKINANNTRIYTDVMQITEVGENIDYLIRKESQIRIVDVKSKTQGSVTFTLSEPVKLTLENLSVICNAGKSIHLFHLETKDDTTYTITTSYYKNSSYGLYITLPTGNIISKDFTTDYANPTVTDVVTERVSNAKANLKLYGVDEGGTIYYILEEATKKSAMSASDIKENGKAESVKVGFNSIEINDLEQGKSYSLSYVIEGYFSNLSSVNGPFTIESEIKKTEQSKYEIVYAKEEVRNRFVFKLNRIPEKELTLQDFEIHCPSDSSLTTKGATFYVSPDLLTYIIVIPDNYGHKDNEYTVKLQVSENEKIEKSFATHMNPPVITGAVDGVVRDSQTTAKFTFNSDEAGTVYYGVYEWNGGIYDYNTSTPFASDVITGKVESSTQPLYAGSNTITLDLSNISVTRNTRIWALFVDEVGNYRVGFVDHYRIPEYVELEPPKPESTLQIVDFKFTDNNFFEIEFSEEILYNIESNDVTISVVGAGSLPSKLLYVIDNSMPKKVTIKVQNYTLPVGEYELAIVAFDKDENEVKFVRKVEVK